MASLRPVFLLLFSCFVVATAKPLFANCSTAGNFTANSSFSFYLNTLLSNLPSAVADGYANATLGVNSATVYGIADCRGDVNVTNCNNCLSTAGTDIRRLCKFSRTATIRYDYCLLRYSDQSFFGSFDYIWLQFIKNPVNVSSDVASRFERRVNTLMVALASRATFNSSGRLFATGEVNFTAADPKIYGLVQCTRDLSPEDCQQCLQMIVGQIPTCCGQRRGGQVITAICVLRFELYGFYAGAPDVVVPALLNADDFAPAPAPSTPPPSPPPPPPPPPPPSETTTTPPPLPPPPQSTMTTGPSNSSSRRRRRILPIIIIPAVVGGVLILAAIICFFKRRSRSESPPNEERVPFLFDLSTLRTATNNFSEENKLGQGGFGPVYKGSLVDGKEIAIKRLSRNSCQGVAELKSELVLVGKLQHRNLVKLLGICLEEQEKLLVYEFLPNKSLDTFLFDNMKQKELNWRRRCNIIHGIARGLQYLHEESQLKIIHRDLKASNILLDADLNPKISDFGMARLFAIDQSSGRTIHVAGTFGYMAPEYVRYGQYSSKSDVYSFGILVLEIVTGRNKRSLVAEEQYTDFLSNIWEHWKRGATADIVEPSLGRSFSVTEAARCVQVGLLCVQDDPAERPRMSSVALMLSSTSTTIAFPSRPVPGNTPEQKPSSSGRRILMSVNEESITELEGR